MNRFQGISCLISKDILLVKNTNFSSQMLYRSVSNEQISRDFLPDFKREPSTVWSTCIKNYIYSQNEQISVHLCGKLHIFIKLPDFNEIKEMNRFQSNYRFQWFQGNFKREPSTVWCTSIIKSPDFNEIKEITDFNQFLKQSLLPKKQQNEHISMKSRKLQKYHILPNFPKRAFYRSVLLHENFQYFGPNHDISRLCEQLLPMKYSFLPNQYLTWKLLGPLWTLCKLESYASNTVEIHWKYREKSCK